MNKISYASLIASGFAMFSMFFGAGNVIYPLAVGQYTQDANFWGMIGLLLTAVGVPFLGLISIILYDGNYHAFFSRIGKIPGFITAAAIMSLIGPFGATPRTVVLAYSTMKLYIPSLNLPLFAFISCLIIFIFAFRRNRILDLIGYFLTPFLLISLGIIVIKGFLYSPSAPISDHSALQAYVIGLVEGYNTMDLMGAFFFASVILVGLKRDMGVEEGQRSRRLIILSLNSSLIGAFLLTLVYVGFSYVAAFNSVNLEGVEQSELIGTVALHVLGPYAGIVVCTAVALACLTTAIALSSVFAEFVYGDLTQSKLGYVPSLIISLVITFFFSTLEFKGIMEFLVPILKVFYPSLILLSVLNLLFKLYNFKPIKIPVFTLFGISLIVHLLTNWS